MTKEQFISGVPFYLNNSARVRYRLIYNNGNGGELGYLQEITGPSFDRSEYNGNVSKCTKARFLAYTSIGGKVVRRWLNFSDYTAVNSEPSTEV